MNKQTMIFAVTLSIVIAGGVLFFISRDGSSKTSDPGNGGWNISPEESMDKAVTDSDNPVSVDDKTSHEEGLVEPRLEKEKPVAFLIQEPGEVVLETVADSSGAVSESIKTKRLDFPMYSLEIPDTWVLKGSSDTERDTWFRFESADFYNPNTTGPTSDLTGFSFQAYSPLVPSLVEKETTAEDFARQLAQLDINAHKASGLTYKNSYVKIDRDDQVPFTLSTTCIMERKVCESSAGAFHNERRLEVFIDYEDTTENREIGNRILESIILK